MPFSKKNPGTTIDSVKPSNRKLQKQLQKKNRKSGKISPPVSAAMRTWQKQCRISWLKPIEEVK
jgi:hypothetical protein